MMIKRVEEVSYSPSHARFCVLASLEACPYTRKAMCKNHLVLAAGRLVSVALVWGLFLWLSLRMELEWLGSVMSRPSPHHTLLHQRGALRTSDPLRSFLLSIHLL